MTEPYDSLPEASNVVKQLYFDQRDIVKQVWEKRGGTKKELAGRIPPALKY